MRGHFRKGLSEVNHPKVSFATVLRLFWIIVVVLARPEILDDCMQTCLQSHQVSVTRGERGEPLLTWTVIHLCFTLMCDAAERACAENLQLAQSRRGFPSSGADQAGRQLRHVID